MMAMEAPHQLLLFTLGEQRYGLALSSVERAVRIVEITPLPHKHEVVLGVINVQGRLIPVMNLRRRFRLPEREVSLADQIVIAHTKRRPVALVVDAVVGVHACLERQMVGAGEILPGIEYVDGVVQLDDGLILIHDLDKFLSLDEATALDAAMVRQQ